MEALNLFYKDVLKFAKLNVNPAGVVLTEEGDPVILQGGNMLVLPTREQLMNLTDDKEVFHPLSEDTLMKISPPLSELIRRINLQLNISFATFALELIGIACSPARNREMAAHPDRLRILRAIEGKGSDSLTLEKNEKLLKWMVKQLAENPSAFLSFSVRRGGEFQGKRQARVGYVNFGLYKRLKEDFNKARKDSEFPSLTKEQVGMVTQIYETIFPDLEKDEAYNFGYAVGPYPFFTTIMQTALNLAEPLNDAIQVFEGTFSMDEDIELSLDWKEVFQDKDTLNKLRFMVGNLDKTSELEKGPARTTPTVAAAPVQQQQPAYQAPQAQQQAPVATPQSASTPGRVSMDDWLKTRAAPSGLAHQGAIMNAMQQHNQNYPAWYAQATAANRGVPPYGFPHPSQIPQGAQAPMYPGSPLAPQQQQVQYQQPAPYQQPVYQNQPAQFVQQPAVDAWGRPLQGAPVYAPPQQQAPMYGAPMYGAPQQPQNAWGTPVQAGYATQPAWQQSGFGQGPNGTVIPGAR